MKGFIFTKLADGETIVWGISSSSSSVSFGFSRGGQTGGASSARMRLVGVTNQRIIIEESQDASKTVIVPNEDVTRVELRRDKFGVALTKIETKRGQKIDVKLIGLTPPQAMQVNQVFPNAKVDAPKEVFAMPAPPVHRPLPPKPTPVRPGPPPRATAAPAPAWSDKSIISDPDIKGLDDLKRCYPLPEGYEYRQKDGGNFVVARTSDGAQFGFLIEEGMMGFDIPTPEGPRPKKTIEIVKQA